MKVSIVTVCYNAANHIAKCIQSVNAQDYQNIEYIVIDGASSDGTVDILNKHKDCITHLVSEPDKGLYHAMNKGLHLATGDLVGILNADDIYAENKVISSIVEAFNTHQTDAICSNIAIYKDPDFKKKIRFYDASKFRLWQFKMGMQPPHPGFFVKRSCYQRFGMFDEQYRISADFDLMLRFLYIHKISYKAINLLSVKMQDGGASNSGLKSKVLMNKEDLHSLKKNGVKSNALFVWSKYFLKVFQFLG